MEVQELGETSLAIMENDNRIIQQILDANTNRPGKYWIMLVAKRMKNHINGRPAVRKMIKAYAERPPSFVGAILGEVDNDNGTIRWEVNMPDVPIDYAGVRALGAKDGAETIIETATLGDAYMH